jgi:cell division protein ZapA
MKNFIPANVVIGDRTYRIKVEAENEEMVRKISKKLNEQLNNFKSLYAGKDMQDYIAMVLLWFVSENHEKSIKIKTEVISDKLTNIEREIDKCLED